MPQSQLTLAVTPGLSGLGTKIIKLAQCFAGYFARLAFEAAADPRANEDVHADPSENTHEHCRGYIVIISIMLIIVIMLIMLIIVMVRL